MGNLIKRMWRSTRSTTSYLSGFSLLKKTLFKTKEIVNDKTARYGLTLFSQAIKKLTPEVSDRKESFVMSCERQNINPEDLAGIATSLQESSKHYRIFSYISIILMLVSMGLSSNIYWFVLYSICWASIASLMMAFAFRDTFRLWQVEKRDLDSIRAFLDEGGLVRVLAG